MEVPNLKIKIITYNIIVIKYTQVTIKTLVNSEHMAQGGNIPI